ncbi:MAG: hypothetical protein DRI24_21595 [Deltaproteobacteria bacterium]|nr:MAG: hypothetical protein DRI24_21595 [Deltaproteobacteria bacterium]
MSLSTKIFNSISNNRTGRALATLFGKNAPESLNILFDSSNGKIGSAAGAGLSPAIWGDCPRGLMLVDPTLGHFVGDDFTKANTKTFTTAYDYELAGTNGTFTQGASDPNGVAVITATGSDNDEANVNMNSGTGIIKLDASTDWWFETRVKINQITTAQGVFVGLITDDITMGTDFHTDNTMAMKVQDALGFQIIAATNIAAVWQSQMTLTGGARAAINATLETASTGWIKLGMKCVSGVVTFFVNGVLDAESTTSATTNYPLDQYVVPAFATKCGSATANTLSVDWWYATQLR